MFLSLAKDTKRVRSRLLACGLLGELRQQRRGRSDKREDDPYPPLLAAASPGWKARAQQLVDPRERAVLMVTNAVKASVNKPAKIKDNTYSVRRVTRIQHRGVKPIEHGVISMDNVSSTKGDIPIGAVYCAPEVGESVKRIFSCSVSGCRADHQDVRRESRTQITYTR